MVVNTQVFLRAGRAAPLAESAAPWAGLHNLRDFSQALEAALPSLGTVPPALRKPRPALLYSYK